MNLFWWVWNHVMSLLTERIKSDNHKLCTYMKNFARGWYIYIYILYIFVSDLANVVWRGLISVSERILIKYENKINNSIFGLEWICWEESNWSDPFWRIDSEIVPEKNVPKLFKVFFFAHFNLKLHSNQ